MLNRFWFIYLLAALVMAPACTSSITTEPQVMDMGQGQYAVEQTTIEQNASAKQAESTKSKTLGPQVADKAYGDVAEDEFDEDDSQGTTKSKAPSGPIVADPIEPFNRAMFTFNDRLYFWVLKPAAQGYQFVVPDMLRRGIKNFFYNLVFPVRFGNNLFQGKLLNAAREADRFIVNTCFGGLGLADLAGRHPELILPAEDAGQTLGSYGIGNGFYIVWPLLGPSTLRDSAGRVVDAGLDPLTYAHPLELTLGARGLDRVNQASLSLGEYEAIKKSSIDPYTAIKDGYLQYRQSQIKK